MKVVKSGGDLWITISKKLKAQSEKLITEILKLHHFL